MKWLSHTGKTTCGYGIHMHRLCTVSQPENLGTANYPHSQPINTYSLTSWECEPPSHRTMMEQLLREIVTLLPMTGSQGLSE